MGREGFMQGWCLPDLGGWRLHWGQWGACSLSALHASLDPELLGDLIFWSAHYPPAPLHPPTLHLHTCCTDRLKVAVSSSLQFPAAIITINIKGNSNKSYWQYHTREIQLLVLSQLLQL